MLYYLYYYLGWIKKDIMLINSFCPTTRDLNYAIEVFPTDDDDPPPRVNRVYYDH